MHNRERTSTELEAHYLGCVGPQGLVGKGCGRNNLGVPPFPNQALPSLRTSCFALQVDFAALYARCLSVEYRAPVIVMPFDIPTERTRTYDTSERGRHRKDRGQ